MMQAARKSARPAPALKPSEDGTVRFRARLEHSAKMGAATWLTIPFDVHEVFGTKARMPVRAWLDGFEHRTSIFPMIKGGGPGTFMLVVNQKVRAAAGLEQGQTIEVVLKRDEKPRTIATPRDLAAALRKSPTAKAAWNKLSYSHKREYVQAIEEAKKPETRQRRIAGCVEMVAKLAKK